MKIGHLMIGTLFLIGIISFVPYTIQFPLMGLAFLIFILPSIIESITDFRFELPDPESEETEH